jgi:hypothetical protein
LNKLIGLKAWKLEGNGIGNLECGIRKDEVGRQWNSDFGMRKVRAKSRVKRWKMVKER